MRGIDNLRLSGFTIELHWVPAHASIDGNEVADKLAKEATGWRLKKLRRGRTREENTSSTAPQAQYVKKLLSAKKTQLALCALNEWKQKWTTETRGRALHKLEPSPRRGIVKLHAGLTKELSALVIQMRTEKIGLCEFLFQRKVPGIEVVDASVDKEIRPLNTFY